MRIHMKKRNTTPTHSVDHDGLAIVRVPLANGGTAKLFPDDYDGLLSQGLASHWASNDSGNGYAYVKCRNPRHSLGFVIVARCIAKAMPGQMVKYQDGDRMNLRLDNLKLVKCSHSKHAAVMDSRQGAAPVPTDVPPAHVIGMGSKFNGLHGTGQVQK
jgi:hypothetical protein